MPCSDYDYKCDDCTDAWDLSRWYGCNESPNPVTDLSEVEVGDCVEANQGDDWNPLYPAEPHGHGERFWVQVTDVCGCYIVGIVLGPLLFPHPFSVGDTIRLEIYHIYNVDKGCKNVIT